MSDIEKYFCFIRWTSYLHYQEDIFKYGGTAQLVKKLSGREKYSLKDMYDIINNDDISAFHFKKTIFYSYFGDTDRIYKIYTEEAFEYKFGKYKQLF
jgi:hypothetical protein